MYHHVDKDRSNFQTIEMAALTYEHQIILKSEVKETGVNYVLYRSNNIKIHMLSSLY